MRPSLCAATILGGLFIASPAWADPVGIVVRVSTDGSAGAPTSVNLVPEAGGEAVPIALNDTGEPPDVDAGDKTFSGSAWVDGDAFSVQIDLGDRAIDGGRVSWSPDEEQRDLNITMVGELVTAEASISRPLPPQPGESGFASKGEGKGEGKSEGKGEGATGPQAGAGMALGTGSQAAPGSPGGSSRGLQLLGLLLGLVALVAVVWWWRQPDEGGDEELGRLELLPEPGLLGPGTPSPSEGVAVWGVSREEAPLLVGPLLGTLAAGRAVVMGLPATMAAPPVLGGPVYRVGSSEPANLGQALAALRRKGTARVAGFVVVEQLSPTLVAQLAKALPAGVGITVLAIDPPEGTEGLVMCRRHGQRWLVGSGAKELKLRVGLRGLELPEDE